MRTASIIRKTAETDIKLELNLDGLGKSTLNTGVGFMDHMLTLLASHADFDLNIVCKGDLDVDDHHSVEDIGICLGQAFSQALGNKAGIARYGFSVTPMDESLVLCEAAIDEAIANAKHVSDTKDAVVLSAIDISGRATLVFDVEIPTEKVGTFDTELVEEFLLAFVRNANITLHVRLFTGTNSHHIIECVFKSLAHTLKMAVAVDEEARKAGKIPSTKGSL